MQLDLHLDLNEVAVQIFDNSKSLLTPEGKAIRQPLFASSLVFTISETTTVMTRDAETFSFLLNPLSQQESLASSEFSEGEMADLEWQLSFANRQLQGNLYNSSERPVREIHVRIKSPNGEIDRIYRSTVEVAPLHDQFIQIRTELPPLVNGGTYAVTLEKAFSKPQRNPSSSEPRTRRILRPITP